MPQMNEIRMSESLHLPAGMAASTGMQTVLLAKQHFRKSICKRLLPQSLLSDQHIGMRYTAGAQSCPQMLLHAILTRYV